MASIVDILLDFAIFVLEFLLSRIPIVSRLIKVHDESCEQRVLSTHEMLSEKWLLEISKKLNKTFKSSYENQYTPDQIASYINTYSDFYLVLVKRAFFNRPLNSEKIVAMIKIAPLTYDLREQNYKFDSYKLQPNEITSHLSDAKSIWIGDLICENNQLIFFLIHLREKISGCSCPVYCRTIVPSLKRILLERYGAFVANPNGKDISTETVICLRR